MPKQTNPLSYQSLLDQATQQLYAYTDSPKIDAEILLQHVINKPLAWLFTYGESIALANHVQDFHSLVDRRQLGEPIAYIVGHKEFWSLDLKVNKHVLVPRADTETLVEQALEFVHSNAISRPCILDLGTGSGAIACALASELDKASITATDSSNHALDVARNNARRNDLHKIRFLQGSWYQALPHDQTNQFDLITANPPYIASDDDHLGQGDLRFEPDQALISHDNGLNDLKQIITDAPEYLKTNGMLIVEHGFAQGTDVNNLFNVTTNFADITMHLDLNQLPRCTSGLRN